MYMITGIHMYYWVVIYTSFYTSSWKSQYTMYMVGGVTIYDVYS